MEALRRFIEYILPWYDPVSDKKKDDVATFSIIEAKKVTDDARFLINDYRRAGNAIHKHRGA
jgi:hypothetical protein